jgi:hypothetical protein
VGFDELFGLHEHAARAAAGVVHLAVVRGEHGHQGLDDAGRRVELAPLLAFGAGELAQEVFVHLTEHVAGLAASVPKPMVEIRSTSSPSLPSGNWARA